MFVLVGKLYDVFILENLLFCFNFINRFDILEFCCCNIIVGLVVVIVRFFYKVFNLCEFYLFYNFLGDGLNIFMEYFYCV